MTDKRFNFTKTAINEVLLPGTGKRVYYYDDQVRGLALLVLPSGAKSFYVAKKINSYPEKIFLGQFPDLTVANARKLAEVKLGQIAMGINPNAESRAIKSEMTFGTLFREYMERYSKIHKKSWKYDEREINKFLSDWFKRRISDIERYEIQYLIERIFKENGLYQANRILERVRAIYNKAIEWGWKGTNPAIGIKKYREKSRDRFIQPYEMPHILVAIEEEQNQTAKDFFSVLLFCGARKTNTQQMRWDEITWEQNIWTIPDTKNGDPVIVPLSPRAVKLLKRREAISKSEWVFPQEKNEDKPFEGYKRSWKRILERATLLYWKGNEKSTNLVNSMEPFYQSGVSASTLIKRILKTAEIENIRLPKKLTDIRIHDIRRTFGSYQAISGASLQIIGKSLGHKSVQSTQIYARLSMDAVRSSVETATDLIFEAA